MSLRKKLKKHKQMHKERGRNMCDINSGKESGELSGEVMGNKQNDDKKLPDDENPWEKVEKNGSNDKEGEYLRNLISPDEYKADFPEIEVIKIEDESEEEIPLNEDENIDLSNQNIQKQNEYCEKLSLSSADMCIGSHKRGLFPESKIRNCKLSEVPNLKRCLIEHSYFQIDKPCFIPLTNQGNIRVNTLRNADARSTVPFQNRIDLNENRTEQQTLAETDSITKHVFHNSHFNLSNNNLVRENCRKGAVSRSARNSSNCESDNSDANQKSTPLRYSLRSLVRRPSSNGSTGNVDNPRDVNTPMTRSLETEVCVNPIEGNKLISDSVKSKPGENRIVSLDDIAKEISEMEKIIQAKCEVSCDNKKDKIVESGDAKVDVQPPKLRKIRSKDELPKSQNEGEYIRPMPNLTKMVPEDKNWNLEYTEEDVKNLGLDDLLLRASELNAENFTKALGQNTTGRNGNKTEASEIVLSFPPARRPEEATSKESDSSKTGSTKRTKLDFYKKYVKDDKSVKAPEEEVKTAPVSSPKRLGIKVKTVQNINEEFKDSLGAKLKNLEASDSVMSKPIYKISDDGPKEVQNKELFLPDAREEMVSTRPTILGRKIHKPPEQNKSSVEDAEETRPFIMTIIQNKDNVANDRIPRVLSPKIFTRPKPVSENGLEERRIETKKDGGGENVTLVVSEPRNSRPFEVVNVEDYIPDPNCYQQKKNSALNYVVHYRNGSFARKRDVEGKILQHTTTDAGSVGSEKKKNIPFILNNTKKYFRMANGEKTLVTTVEDPSKRIVCASRPANRLMKHSLEGGAQGEKSAEKGSFTVTSIEQKIVPKEGGLRFVKVATSDQNNKAEEPRSEEQPAVTETADGQPPAKHQLMSLAAFSNILKDILPDKWILSLDKRYGLQILKTHLDELLNPSIMISVVVGRTGKVTVNVRGRQLEKSHDLFSNLCDVGNSSEKISINYILSIINKLRFFNVCFGCDDLSLKKYWCEDGFIEYYTEFQQTYRSHICESLVRLGKRRCYPCHRMHESLKKRKRREQLGRKEGESSAKTMESGSKAEEVGNPGKGTRKNFEEFIEESFINMKQKITDEIEKTREDEESEKVPKTQDEVLSFMGLTRKDSLDVNLRKSKRERKGFKKCESMIGNNVNKEELYFLEKYWTDINVLFSTSLLIGAYSRTSTPRLREKCRMFHKLLSTWRGIVRDNPDWVGGYMNLAENLVEDDVSPVNADSAKEKFDKMDIPALRAYIINCVKEVNKIKSRLRTKNAYFKVLYNTFVKPRMKKARQSSEATESTDGKADQSPEKEPRKEDSPEKADDAGKPSNSANTTSTEMDSSDEKEEDSRHSNGVASGVSDGD